MEILMQHIPYTVNQITLTRKLAHVLHNQAPFTQYNTSGGPMNFKVYLLPNQINRRHNSGDGSLTLPSREIGEQFLRIFGDGPTCGSTDKFIISGGRISFKRSRYNPRPEVLKEIQSKPYRDPTAIIQAQTREANLKNQVILKDVQYLWMCRDATYSIEWRWKKEEPQDQVVDLHLHFKDNTREVVVARSTPQRTHIISMPYSRIEMVKVDMSSRSLVFYLELPPSYELADHSMAQRQGARREKLDSLSGSHGLVGPFTWKTIRLVCASRTDIAEFKRMADVTRLHVRDPEHVELIKAGRFAPDVLSKLRACFPALPWSVAFLCEKLIRDQLLDARELHDLQPLISSTLRDRGPKHTMQVMQRLFSELIREKGDPDGRTCEDCFITARDDVAQNRVLQKLPDQEPRHFQCFHVAFTPSRMELQGPFTETSNRILRQYPKNHENFLRVSWTDEDGQTGYRYDRREVDGPRFVKKYVGRILKEGFELCGRRFEFLAYSQSALKQYTVWFVNPFKNSKGRQITAAYIRSSIGSKWDDDLMRCPARYAARLSQAFTATEPSIFVEPDQIFKIDDIERNKFCFSDGNGPMSQEMANAIQDALATNGGARGRNPSKRVPSVFQIRIQGAKGVISVDPTLKGLQLGLRPSMIKFESIHHNDVEIARSFSKPIKFFLNRPLIMILAGLGVNEQVFLDLQASAVQSTETAAKSLKRAGELLETHGMGMSFALSSTFSNLRKLGISLDPTPTTAGFRDEFVDRCLKFAIHHVQREIKFKARIPVPECWKLVGVVDVHNILRPNEIYACIVRGEGSQPEYIKGPILLSKSPTIHPGDVQIAQAIGQPPPGSPLRHLINCVVFSQQGWLDNYRKFFSYQFTGDRPLPNKLSGSDLDGDEYDLIPVTAKLHPPKIVAPGEYPPAPRKKLERRSNIEDVADFVVDFINNDMLGIIATNFLLIADTKGIFNPKCAELAELHSWAVDFPKNGVPVPNDRIPQPEGRDRPDWNAPEMVNIVGNANYYESQSILGKLFRGIDLPVLSGSNYETRAQPRRKRKENPSIQDTLVSLSLGSWKNPEDPISIRLQEKLSQHVTLKHRKDMAEFISDLFDHFATELENICFQHSLARHAVRRLSEEEVLVGTIVAKSTQPRLRKEKMASMRLESSVLVQRMWKELQGSHEEPPRYWANRAWMAWKVSQLNEDVFGARSFGFVALRSIFEVIKTIESSE